MKTVAEGNNPHVVNMIGCVTIQEPLCLVTEFVMYGDLLTYLNTLRRMVRTYVHVHSHSIYFMIHADMRPSNITPYIPYVIV